MIHPLKKVTDLDNTHSSITFCLEPQGATAPRLSGDSQISGFMRIGVKGSVFGLVCPAQAYPAPKLTLVTEGIIRFAFASQR
jgi:hypothetical protein